MLRVRLKSDIFLLWNHVIMYSFLFGAGFLIKNYHRDVKYFLVLPISGLSYPIMDPMYPSSIGTSKVGTKADKCVVI